MSVSETMYVRSTACDAHDEDEDVRLRRVREGRVVVREVADDERERRTSRRGQRLSSCRRVLDRDERREPPMHYRLDERAPEDDR